MVIRSMFLAHQYLSIINHNGQNGQLGDVGRHPLRSPDSIRGAAGAKRSQKTRHADEITRMIESLSAEPGRTVIVLPSAVAVANRGLIIALLARHRLPAVYEFPVFARERGD